MVSMLRTLLAGALLASAAIAVGACAKKDAGGGSSAATESRATGQGSASGQPTTTAANGVAPAAHVVSLVGRVTAKAEGAAARALQPGDGVASDDTIATADGARVDIQIDHNQAHLKLAANQSVRLDTSLAWKLSHEEVGQLPVDDQTATAGRPAQNDAAHSMVEAANVELVPRVEPETPAFANAGSGGGKTPADKLPGHAVKPTAPSAGITGTHGTKDVGVEPLDPQPHNARGPAPDAPVVAPGPEQQKAAERDDDKKRIEAPAPAIKRCFTGVSGQVTVVVDAAGKVTRVTRDAGTVTAEQTACVGRAVTALKLRDVTVKVAL